MDPLLVKDQEEQQPLKAEMPRRATVPTLEVFEEEVVTPSGLHDLNDAHVHKSPQKTISEPPKPSPQQLGVHHEPQRRPSDLSATSDGSQQPFQPVLPKSQHVFEVSQSHQNLISYHESPTLPPPASPVIVAQEVHKAQQYPAHAISLPPVTIQADHVADERINLASLEEYMASETAKEPAPIAKNGEVRIEMDSFHKGANTPKHTFYSIVEGAIHAEKLHGLAKTKSLRALLHMKNFWLDTFRPSIEEMKRLASVFNIHPLTMEDILTGSTREKFEMYKSYYFICYCALDEDPESPTYLDSFNVYILVYSDFILTFHFSPLPCVNRVTRRLDQLKQYLKITPHWINYAILDDITDNYAPLTQSIELEVDAIDDLVLVISQSEQSDMLRRIANARKRVTLLQRLLATKSDVLKVLIKRLEGMAVNGLDGNSIPTPSWTAMLKDTCLYLGDVQDHAITMVQTLGHVDQTLNRCHSNYLAQINIEITQTSNKSSASMNKLTAVASIFVPLNIITGLWGMNVTVPGQTTEDPSLGPFVAISMALLVYMVMTWLLIVKWNFLDRISGRKRRLKLP